MDKREYFSAFPQHLDADSQVTTELKTFSKELDTAERRHQTSLRASEEHSRRITRYMVYLQVSYEAAGRIVADQDDQLMQLYSFGEILREK